LQADLIEDGGGGDFDFVDGGGLADEGDDVVAGSEEARGFAARGEEVGDGEMLGLEEAVEGSEAEHSLAMEEIGDVGGLEFGFAGEQRGRQRPASNTAKHFDPELFVQLGKIH